ncbi:hypothetical protein, partial [Streptomyces griseorubiginosus]|uniref:hypothetical protein n=1 Tax=Streptomyces griseorubiginosus TaxID=67304 RepID=UPI001AD748B3
LLAAVAERLTRCADEAGYARASAPLVARLGGDEFALLVEDSTEVKTRDAELPCPPQPLGCAPTRRRTQCRHRN